MGLDLANYPINPKGARSMIEAITPKVVEMWKAGRQALTDDVVAIVDPSNNQIRLEGRLSVYGTLRRRDPSLSLLSKISDQPLNPNGTIRIWALIGFPRGQIYMLPLTLAYS